VSRIATLVPYFGSNRSLARHVGAQLAGRAHVTVPFAGGMCELAHVRAPTLLVSDLHRHVINLANVLRCPRDGPRLVRDLRRVPFHPDLLAQAQAECAAHELAGFPNESGPVWERLWNYAWARAYFVCAWVARNGKAGTGDEFAAGLSVRYAPGGGDSAVRFRSAVEALRAWRRIMPRCTFQVRDCFAALADVRDGPGCGVYCDPPFPGPGDSYKHRFTAEQHRELARRLTGFARARVVCRFYDHPLVRELYPPPHWRWLDLTGGKTQTNAAAPEVLLLNGDPIPDPDTEK
jgi:DNA adenine methylase